MTLESNIKWNSFNFPQGNFVLNNLGNQIESFKILTWNYSELHFTLDLSHFLVKKTVWRVKELNVCLEKTITAIELFQLFIRMHEFLVCLSVSRSNVSAE